MLLELQSSGLHDPQSCAFDHSANRPVGSVRDSNPRNHWYAALPTELPGTWARKGVEPLTCMLVVKNQNQDTASYRGSTAELYRNSVFRLITVEEEGIEPSPAHLQCATLPVELFFRKAAFFLGQNCFVLFKFLGSSPAS